MNQLEGVAIPTLPTVTMTVDPNGSLRLVGSLATRNPNETISPFFRELHRAILADGLKQFTIDVAGLTFANSASIRLFVDWVILAEREPSESRYKVIVRMSEKVTWQKTSLRVLRAFAPSVVVLEKV